MDFKSKTNFIFKNIDVISIKWLLKKYFISLLLIHFSDYIAEVKQFPAHSFIKWTLKTFKNKEKYIPLERDHVL